MKDVCGFAENQVKTTFGLSYKLTLKKNFYNTVLSLNAATTDGETETERLSWNVPQYTASVIQQQPLKARIIQKLRTELSYEK